MINIRDGKRNAKYAYLVLWCMFTDTRWLIQDDGADEAKDAAPKQEDEQQ